MKEVQKMRFKLIILLISMSFVMAGNLWAGWFFGGPPQPEPEPVTFPYAAKIYATQLNGADISWIAKRCNLLVADGSVDPWMPELKAEDPNLLIYRYFTTCTAKILTSGYISSVPLGNLLEEHDDWFWKTSEGNHVRPSTFPKAYLMDPGAEGWSDYWLERVAQITRWLSYDGIMGDVAAIDVRTVRGKCPDIDNRYPSEAEFHEVQERHLSALHDGLNDSGKRLILNNVTTRSVINPNYLLEVRIYNEDGFMWQTYAMKGKEHPDAPFVSPEAHESQMNLVDFCADIEKTLILGMQPRVNRDDIEYCIGCFLLVRHDPYVYLNIDWDGNYGNMRMLFEQFGDLFEVDYGEPKGERYKSGELWVRNYSKGRVKVNLQTHTFEFQKRLSDAKNLD